MIRSSGATSPRRAVIVRLVAGALFALALAGCGNGSSSGDGDPDPPGDTTAPVVTVSFPTAGSLTDASTVTVRGTAADPSGVESIRVNGVEADTSDGFATWTAEVPLVLGTNVLQARAEDGEDNVAFPALEWTVTRADERLILPTAIASDLARARLVVVDAALDVVVGVDPNLGTVTNVSAAGSSGIAFEAPTSADVDAGRDRVLVVDRGRNELVAVALSTGTRSILVPSGTFQPIDVTVDSFRDVAYVSEVEQGIVVVNLASGEHEPLDGVGTLVPGIGGVAHDVPRDRVLATRNGPLPALLAFDATDGELSVVSGDAVGTGPLLVDPRDVAIDPLLSHALVTDAGLDAVVRIDLVTGDRSVLSGPGQGSGPELSEPAQLVIDAFARAVVVDLAHDALVRVELPFGDRGLFTGTAVGTGPRLAQPVSLISQPGGVLVADRALPAVVAISNATGARAPFSGGGLGSGPEMVEPARLVTGPFFFPGIRAYLADAGLAAILVVAPSGDRTELSGPSAGAGPELIGPRDLAVVYGPPGPLEPEPDFLVVADCPLLGPGRLVVVDAFTGDRIVMIEPGTGDPDVIRPTAVELIGPERLVVLDEANDTLVEVDLSTGIRSMLSDSGQGPEFDGPGPKDLLFQPSEQRILVADSARGRVLAVRLDDGTRTVFTGEGAGDGPRLLGPAGLEIGPPPLVGAVSGSVAVTTVRVVDLVRGALLVVDPDGDRVIVSK